MDPSQPDLSAYNQLVRAIAQARRERNRAPRLIKLSAEFRKQLVSEMGRDPDTFYRIPLEAPADTGDLPFILEM